MGLFGDITPERRDYLQRRMWEMDQRENQVEAEIQGDRAGAPFTRMYDREWGADSFPGPARELREAYAYGREDGARDAPKLLAPLVMGYWHWPCDNPYRECVYNHDVDPMHDHCLFCEQPEERK